MSVVTVQMTLMRYTDLSARPRHNNNHVSALTPIITQQIKEQLVRRTQRRGLSLLLKRASPG